MSHAADFADDSIDPRYDLVLERFVDVPPELVWKAWTVPEHLMPWFCPKPWRTVECEIDLRPGGIFRTFMRSPEGDEHPNEGCYLEVVPNRRLVWTDALRAGFRPAPGPNPMLDGHFTGYILLAPRDGGTLYRAVAKHGTETGRDKHDRLGFQDGWGTVLTQLVEYVKESF